MPVLLTTLFTVILFLVKIPLFYLVLNSTCVPGLGDGSRGGAEVLKCCPKNFRVVPTGLHLVNYVAMTCVE